MTQNQLRFHLFNLVSHQSNLPLFLLFNRLFLLFFLAFLLFSQVFLLFSQAFLLFNQAFHLFNLEYHLLHLVDPERRLHSRHYQALLVRLGGKVTHHYQEQEIASTDARIGVALRGTLAVVPAAGLAVT